MPRDEILVDTAPRPKPAALWEDFIDVFYAPSSVFRRREKQSFWLPWLIVSVVTAVIVVTTFSTLGPIIEETVNKGIAAGALTHPERTEAAKALARTVGVIVIKVAMVASTPFAILLVGFVAWLVGKLFFRSTQTLNTALVVTTYAFVPRVVGAVLTAMQSLVLDVSRMHSLYRLALGPVRFFDPAHTSEGALQLLARFDPLTLWTAVLIGIGYTATTRMSRLQATVAAIAIWVVGTLPALLALARGL